MDSGERAESIRLVATPAPRSSRKKPPLEDRYSGDATSPTAPCSLSPSDLSAHLACPHLTTLSLRPTRARSSSRSSSHRTATSSSARGTSTRLPTWRGSRPRGARSCGSRPTTTRGSTPTRRSGSPRRRSAQATAEVIYQPYLTDGTLARVRRLPRAPARRRLRARRHEARAQAKPAHVLQLCFYAEQLGADLRALP